MAISNQAIRQGARYFGAVYGELSKGYGLQRVILKQVSTNLMWSSKIIFIFSNRGWKAFPPQRSGASVAYLSQFSIL